MGWFFFWGVDRQDKDRAARQRWDEQSPLERRAQQAHDDMVYTTALEHVGDELRGDGCAGLVLLILTRIGEVRELGGGGLMSQ